MKKIQLSLFISLIFLMGFLPGCKSGCNKEQTPDEIQSFAVLSKLFADPPSDYRSAPLWDWNEQISEEGIDFQMKEFKKAGIGGVFVHPRPGLITEYLSEEWFHLFDYTIQKGKELGMKVWIYDENSYPSGFAGGHVPAEMPDSYKHGAGLKLDILDKLDVRLSDTIEVILKKTEQGLVDITASAEKEMGQKGTYYLFSKTYPPKSLWYGGFSYVDLLYKGVTEKFMEITMTRGYEKKSRTDFGKTMPGIFTDEPNIRATGGPGLLVRWTPDLWDVFQQRWGYDLRPNLLSLIDESGDWKKVRHDYYEILLELFVDRWAEPWSKYCEEKGLKWTGHYWEHGWPNPTEVIDEPAFYIRHQQPGVDMLGNRLDTAGLGGQFGNDRAVRELRSAANQAGRQRTLSETYGGGGYEMDFKNFKRLVDWEVVLGVNFVNQHLSYYSMNGVRKFDYPPSFSYHEPWWDNYKLMGDYMGRICMAMSAGKQINHTLLLQPNTSAWMYFSRKNRNPEIDVIKDKFKNFVYRMEQEHFEYDLGSEKVLRDLGSVVNGKLQVGKCSYHLVVIPEEMENIDQKTYDLLKEFLAQGGKVLSFRNKIERLDGEASNEVAGLQAKYPAQWILANSLEDKIATDLLKQDDFSISNISINKQLYHQRRILDDGQLLLIVNSDETKKASAKIQGHGKSVVKIDLFTGEQNLIPVETNGNEVWFEINLQPVGSALYFISEKNEKFPELKVTGGEPVKVKPLDEMEIKRLSDNILTIDYLDLKTSKSEMKNVHFMNALISLFKENGVEFGNPWQHKIQYKKNYLELDTLFKDGSGFEVTYHVRLADKMNPDELKKLKAVIERPGLWTIKINGNMVTPLKDQYWIDKDFPVFKIGNYLHPGGNQITLTADRMSVFAEIMPVYILGNFSLVPPGSGFEIDSPKVIKTGSWINAGMPFYSQKVAYTRKFNIENNRSCFSVSLNNWKGTICEVLVNGEKAGLIAFPPYKLDITKYIKQGENTIEVNVTGSLKNTFGYFYRPNNKWIHGPHDWNYAPGRQPGINGMFLMDYGLYEPFDLLSRKE